jgi:hypothetical protein
LLEAGEVIFAGNSAMFDKINPSGRTTARGVESMNNDLLIQLEFSSFLYTVE